MLTLNGPGFVVLENLVPQALIDSLSDKVPKLYPVRASSKDKTYAEKNNIKDLADIAVWWSQLVMDWPEVIEIEKLVGSHVSQYINRSFWYTSDIVTIEPNTEWINPHVDTPHRFKKWNRDTEMLGVQCIVPLQDVDKNNGATGLLKDSHRKNWNIDKCYAGKYDQYFAAYCDQPQVSKGSVLLYNSRMLHSTMSNHSPEPRIALLFNYLDSAIIEDVSSIDNIWNANQNTDIKE